MKRWLRWRRPSSRASVRPSLPIAVSLHSSRPGSLGPKKNAARVSPVKPIVAEGGAPARKTSRDTVRVERATTSGQAWAESLRAALATEGRPATGGWPGTLSEARAKVDQLLHRDGTTEPGERERLTRLLYHSARALWLDNRAPAVAEEPSEP